MNDPNLDKYPTTSVKVVWNDLDAERERFIDEMMEFSDMLTEETIRNFTTSKVYVGQRLFMTEFQRNKDLLKFDVTVKWVGRKYFTLNEVPNVRFRLDNKMDADDDYTKLMLYFSRYCYEHINQKSNLHYRIRSIINQSGCGPLSKLSMFDLKTILNLLKKGL